MVLAITFYNFVTLLVLLVVLAGFTVTVIFFLGLPGKLARNRQHPHADAVNLMGWLGFLGGLPWIHALIWSLHDSWTIDIRRFPEEEREVLKQRAREYEATHPTKTKTPADPGKGQGDKS